MSNLIEIMRKERDRPAVVALAVLRIRSEKPDALVFIFEGIDDVGVYEQWLRSLPINFDYEPVPAGGKKQALSYMRSLHELSSDLLSHVYAFVDRDFDLQIEGVSNVYELDAHSIESLICTQKALESLLLDEFKCFAYPQARQNVLKRFQLIFDAAKKAMHDINFLLFAGQRMGRVVEKKPEKLSHFLNINLNAAHPNFHNATEVVKVELTGIDLEILRKEFESLDDILRYRGKYIYMIFKKWVDLLFLERVRDESDVFKDIPKLINSGACAITHRRLASSVDAPESFRVFIRKITKFSNNEVALIRH